MCGSFFFGAVRGSLQADVALSAVVRVFLAKIGDELSRAARFIVFAIEPHRTYALGEEFATVFVDAFRDGDVLTGFASLRVGDGGCG